MATPDIYNYNCLHEYLAASIGHANSGRKISPGSLARTIGYKSPRSIGMVLNGQRLPSQEMTRKICKYLDLGPREYLYFSELVCLSTLRQAGKNVQEQIQLLEQLKPTNLSERTLELDKFRIISEWYYVPIIVLAQASPIPNDPKWLSEKFLRKLTVSQAKYAIDCLIRERYLTILSTGKLAADQKRFATTQDVSDDGIKKYHTQMLARSREALIELMPANRCFQALTISVAESDFSRMKTEILGFLGNFAKDFEKKPGCKLIQINLQAFPISKSGV